MTEQHDIGALYARLSGTEPALRSGSSEQVVQPQTDGDNLGTFPGSLPELARQPDDNASRDSNPLHKIVLIRKYAPCRYQWAAILEDREFGCDPIGFGGTKSLAILDLLIELDHATRDHLMASMICGMVEVSS